MLSLAETQDRLHRAIIRNEEVDVGFLAGARIAAVARLGIHARHFRQSLTRALERTYPTVVGLVDRRFFGYCADAFIGASPPAGPCLFAYGGAFPNFLATFEPCAALPYIADLARLEWDMHAVFHDLGPDAAAPERWLARGVRLLRSPYPIHRIWQVAHGEVEGPVELNAGVEIVVYRDGADVSFETPSPAAVAFLGQLRVAAPYVGALNAALSIEPAFRVDSHIPAAVRKHLRLSTNKEETGYG